MKNEIYLFLIPAPEDRREVEKYRKERAELEKSLRMQGVIESGFLLHVLEASVPNVDDVANALGANVGLIVTSISTLLSVGLGAWLHGRYGRKVRLKVGPDGIEVEAQTVQELEHLLARAQEIQQSNKPKVIHEP